MPGRPFSARLICDGTWVIGAEGCDCYLLEGGAEAVLIDAGQSAEDIRAYAQALTDRPLRRVVNTHSHFDHTGGNGFFDEVLATPAAARSAKNTMGEPPDLYQLNYGFTYVRDGDTLELGGRRLSIIELDCHSPGDIVILDESRRLLFTGDEVECGQVLLLPGYAERPGQIHARPAASVEAYLRAMGRLAALHGRYDAVCPAHNGAPIDPTYVDWYIRICENILAGQQGSEDCSSATYGPGVTHFPFPHARYRRASWKGAALVYCSALLRETDSADGLPPATPLHLISSYFAPPTNDMGGQWLCEQS